MSIFKGLSLIDKLLDEKFNVSEFNDFNRYFRSKINETDENYNVEVTIPGYKRDEIEISVDNNFLLIDAEKTDNNGYVSKFKESVRLSKDVKPENISAKLEDGILTITIKKEKDNKKRKILIDIN